MTPKKRLTINLISIAIIVFVAFFFLNEISKANKAKEEDFKNDLTATFEAYGDAIDHIFVRGSGVSVYVRKDRWQATSEETQQELIKEMYSLVQISATQHKIKNGLFSLYTSDRNNIVTLSLK